MSFSGLAIQDTTTYSKGWEIHQRGSKINSRKGETADEEMEGCSMKPSGWCHFSLYIYFKSSKGDHISRDKIRYYMVDASDKRWKKYLPIILDRASALCSFRYLYLKVRLTACLTAFQTFFSFYISFLVLSLELNNTRPFLPIFSNSVYYFQSWPCLISFL